VLQGVIKPQKARWYSAAFCRGFDKIESLRLIHRKTAKQSF